MGVLLVQCGTALTTAGSALNAVRPVRIFHGLTIADMDKGFNPPTANPTNKKAVCAVQTAFLFVDYVERRAFGV